MYANNLEMPVTLYRSTDDDAPALTKSNLSLILKACLVTGYGSKPGAGWTMPHEDASLPPRNRASSTATCASPTRAG